MLGTSGSDMSGNEGYRKLKAYAEKKWTSENSIPEIEIAEYTINNLQGQILADIYQRHPDCIMFSCYIWNWNYVQALCKELPKVLPEADLWLGGPEVSFECEEILKELQTICRSSLSARNLTNKSSATFQNSPLLRVLKNSLHDCCTFGRV